MVSFTAISAQVIFSNVLNYKLASSYYLQRAIREAVITIDE